MSALRWWPVGVAALLLMALGAQSWRLTRAEAALERARTANAAQVAEYRQAAVEARADAEEARANALATQQRISDEISTDYESRMATLRARYDSLRDDARAANPRATGVGDMPGIPDPASEPDAATCNTGFLAILQAADENTEKLTSLQDWVRGQQQGSRGASPGAF